MQTHILLHKDYTLNEEGYQLKLPLNLETIIPVDDSVRLLSQFVEAMDLTDLYSTYKRINTVSPRTLLKIVLYSYMNGDYSSRSMERNCKRDINFMYLLEGKSVPDHATFARFRSIHFAPCSKRILAEMSNLLYELGEISGEMIFIDGTKIEVSEKNIYQCEECSGCPYKKECIKGNNCKTPMEERNKVLSVAKTFLKYRKEDLERILSEEGILLRINRSIQVEGSFGELKQDMQFRRYLSRGTSKVLAESVLLVMAKNVNKLHNKIQKGKTGRHLFPLKDA